MRTGQRKDWGKLAEGLMSWTRGEDSEAAEAASEIVAEAILTYLHTNTKE